MLSAFTKLAEHIHSVQVKEENSYETNVRHTKVYICFQGNINYFEIFLAWFVSE